MPAGIAPDPDLWVSSNKGHLPFIAFARGGGSSGLVGSGKRASFEGIRWRGTRRRIPSNLVSRLGKTAERPSGCMFFCSLMAAFLSCQAK